MDVDVSRSTIDGLAKAPPSKSYTHRAVLASGYSGGAIVHDPLLSADTRATIGAVEAFGGEVDMADERIIVDGFSGRPAVPADVVDCGNSGTTMRLVTATAALADGTTVLTGDRSLRSRPHGPLLEAIETLGGRATSTRRNGRAPLVITGPIDGGRVAMPGDVSSQFVSALLMAGATTQQGIQIDLTTPLKSSPYVEITIEVLEAFGVEAVGTPHGFDVDGGQTYEPMGGEYRVPGDFSSISYLLAAGAIAGPDGVTIAGAYPSAQGDSAFVDVLSRMGADIEWDRQRGQVSVVQSPLSGIEVDVGDTPDLLPTIAAVGAVADGETEIVNCEHVRYKETDRVSAMAQELTKLGAEVVEEHDTLVVDGTRSDLVGAEVDGRGDHRIVMALAVAGLAAEGTTTIAGAEHVAVSFPDFFDVLYDLGADVSR